MNAHGKPANLALVEVTQITGRADGYVRLSEKYAAELIDATGFPATHELLLTMLAVAYLEGGMAQMKHARDILRGDGT